MKLRISIQEAPEKLKPIMGLNDGEISKYLRELKSKAARDGKELIGFLGDGRPVSRINGHYVTVRYSYLQILHQDCLKSAEDVIISIMPKTDDRRLKKYIVFVALKLTKEIFKIVRGQTKNKITMTEKWYDCKQKQCQKEIEVYEKSLLMELSDIEKSAARQEYLYIECLKCNERVKLAKNKGRYWKPYNFLCDFLIEHAAYDHEPEDIVLEWER